MISKEKAYELREKIEEASVSLDDEDALLAPELFAFWRPDTQYEVGDRRRYHDILYTCIQVHTSQSDWTPDITSALWKVTSLDEWPEWIQPTGAHDAYHAGDKVSHNEKHWISDIDTNIWEPGVYGWSEVV